MAVILGIDPGSRTTGFGVIQIHHNRCHYLTSGCIRTKSEDVSERLFQIHENISFLIKQYQPTEAAIEKVFVHKNPDSALKLGQARGAAMVAFAGHSIPTIEYSPRLIKQAVVGYGGAEKQQIQSMVKLLLTLSDLPQKDAADALAIALCHAHHRKSNLK